MAQKSEQQIKREEEQNPQQEGEHQQEQQLSEADKKVYDEIFKSLNKIDKKVKDAKTKLHNNENHKKQQKNTNFKQIAEKLIESKQNSDIVNKQDLSSDIGQSFERAVIDIYSQNQKLKKKQAEMQKIIKDQNHKIFQQKTKQQALTKQIQKLRLELAQSKDHNMMVNRSVTKADNSGDNKKQTNKKGQTHNQNNEDYDFWNMPQNDGYNKKKKQFVENSGLWVNQKNVNDSMFITEGRR